MSYEVVKYKRQWSIYCRQSKCYVMFGPKKELEKRIVELNK